MDFVLDACFTLHWCFEDEATAASEAILTHLQDHQDIAWVPAIWSYELLNGLGKGVARVRLERQKAFLALAGNTCPAYSDHGRPRE